MKKIQIHHGVDVVPTTEERLALEGKERAFEDFDKGREHLYEPVGRYRPGGYCPVEASVIPHKGRRPHHRDVCIARRYHVVNKVAYSPFSTTWLCFDRKRQKWRWLEINVASESSGHSREQLIQNTLMQRGVDRATARRYGIVLPYRRFFIRSTNGKHLASVLPVLGPTLAQLMDMNQEDGHRRRQICQSMARSVEYLHRQGICHGNFHPGNVRVWPKEGAFDDYSPKEIWRVFGFPSRRALRLRGMWSLSVTHAPGFMYESFDWYGWDREGIEVIQDKLTTDVAIVDRGGAFLVADGPSGYLTTPIHYQGPECFFGDEEDEDAKTGIRAWI
ncbi:kinase-like protein [Apiospora saccharicola]